MASAAELGLGVALTVAGVDIAEITDIGEFGVTRADQDVTNHDSSGNAEEYIVGLINSLEIPVACNLKTGDTGQMLMITKASASTLTICPCKITLPNTAASTFEFYAYVKSFRIKADAKGQLKFTFTLKTANRAPTWTV